MNIFVSNIAKDVTKDRLREIFSAFGEVTSTTILKDKFNISASSFGFVEMPNSDEAETAIAGLNGQILDGKKLTVHVARRIRSKDRRQTGRGGGRRQTDLMPEL